jgi:tripartite-type tricarboxylate transporter receptor subunit TctC
MNIFRHIVAGFGASLLLLCATAPAQAQFPERPVRIVMPYPAGSNGDISARFLGQRLSLRLKQPVIVENRAGAGGAVGTQAVIASPADGYTMLLHSPAIATEVAMRDDLPYDMRKSLAPVSMVTIGANVLLVRPDLPVKSMAELIAYAKANPGKLNHGSPGINSSIHLSWELFKSMAGVNIVHIPYKGGAPSYQGLATGEIQMIIDPLPTARTLVAAGKARALAVTTAAPSEFWPELPAIGDTVPGYDTSLWLGLFVPAATPKDVQARLSSDVRAVMAEPETREWLSKRGASAVGDTPEEFRVKLDAEVKRWTQMVQATGIKTN